MSVGNETKKRRRSDSCELAAAFNRTLFFQHIESSLIMK
jgi:hypothetical protein